MIAKTILRLLVLFVLLLFGHNPAWAGGIDAVRERIREYGVLSKRYHAEALKLGSTPSLWSKYNYIDAKEQYCEVLADLLDVGQEAMAGAVHSAPGSESTDPKEYILYSLSLRSYLLAAQSLVRQSDFYWRYGWNLNCEGLYNSERVFTTTDQPPFNLTVSDDGTTLSVIGDVKPGLFDAIARRLAIHSSISNLEIQSLGGLTYEAIKIGRLLRKRKISTVVSGNCYSGCALIFLGGVRRIVPAPYWVLGFHRASRRGTPVWDGDEVYEDIKLYVDDMIGDGDGLLKKSLTPVGLDFYRPSRRDLCLSKIATTVENVCEATVQKN